MVVVIYILDWLLTIINKCPMTNKIKGLSSFSLMKFFILFRFVFSEDYVVKQQVVLLPYCLSQ